MKGYIGYIRVSTAKQGERGSSLQEQRSAIEAYAAKHGLSVTEWLEERETAAKQGRRQFTKMLVTLIRRGAAGVIIHKIDRSARNLRDWARLGDLIDRGVDVRFAHESLDLASRGGRLAADIQAVVAADYIRNLREEVRKGFNGRLNQGLYPLPAPLGYRDEGKGKPKSIHPEKGPLVRAAFELYGTGEYPLHALRAEMEERGLRNKSGAPVSLQSLWYVLRNPFYAGVIHIARTGQSFPGVHPPLVSAALFERCQAIMTGRAYVSTTKHTFAFSRFIRCEACGRSLVGERQKGHHYYRCHTASCRAVSFREDAIKVQVATFLSFIAATDEELRDFGELRDRLGADERSERARAIAEAKLALGKCSDRLSRLTDAYLDGTLDRTMFEERKTALLLERQRHQDRIDGPISSSDEVTRLQKIELGNTAISKAISEDWSDIRETVSLTLSNLVAVGKSLGFTPRFPFDEVAKQRCLSDGAPYRSEPRTFGAQMTCFIRESGPLRSRSANAPSACPLTHDRQYPVPQRGGGRT